MYNKSKNTQKKMPRSPRTHVNDVQQVQNYTKKMSQNAGKMKKMPGIQEKEAKMSKSTRKLYPEKVAKISKKMSKNARKMMAKEERKRGQQQLMKLNYQVYD